MAKNQLIWETVISEPFMENTYIAYIEGRDDCLVIDPGMEPDKILRWLRENGRTCAAILNTHGHSDHIAGNESLKTEFPGAQVFIGEGDATKLTDPAENLSAPFGFRLVSPPADRTLAEGDVVDLAGMELAVLQTPGHSIGHVVYVYRAGEPGVVFCGDVIFQGSIGRSDFPDGNLDQLIRSIHEKLFTMPDETILLSGHGGPTTVGAEKRDNPFVGGSEYPG